MSIQSRQISNNKNEIEKIDIIKNNIFFDLKSIDSNLIDFFNKNINKNREL